MRISALSAESGVTVASIKFYLREGLLFPGISTSATQSDYDDSHLARLRLIRALIDVGGLSVVAAGAVLAAIDDDAMPLVHAFGIAQHAVTASLTSNARPSAESLAEVAALKTERGWQTFEENPGEPIVARVIDAFRAIARPDLVELMPTYAEAAELVARADLQSVLQVGIDGRTRMVETVVVGTALGDGLFTGLRRIAQEHIARQLGLPGSSLEPEEVASAPAADTRATATPATATPATATPGKDAS
ncbi:MAG: MerR family transcriptional regulator [Actinomycetota bacterium]|nr:MerR family transcriptional regulator [Actinomycetota bacterium]